MAIEKIDININKVAVWGEVDFDANVHENFTTLKNLVPKINKTVSDIDATVNDIDATEAAILNIKKNIDSSNDEIDSKKADIDTKHSEVMNRVIPTEATYNEQTIDEKVQMSQILNLTGAI